MFECYLLSFKPGTKGWGTYLTYQSGLAVTIPQSLPVTGTGCPPLGGSFQIFWLPNPSCTFGLLAAMCCSLSHTTWLSLVMCILNSPNVPTSIYPLLHIYNKLSRLPYLGKIIFFSSFFISFFKFIIYHFLNLVFRAGSIVQRYICLAQAKPWVQFILPPHTHT